MDSKQPYTTVMSFAICSLFRRHQPLVGPQESSVRLQRTAQGNSDHGATPPLKDRAHTARVDCASGFRVLSWQLWLLR
jgi:hypothetical protein